MKKLVLLGLTLITILPLFCQYPLFIRAEVNTADNIFHGTVTGTTMTWIGDAHIDQKSYVGYTGPNIAHKWDDPVRLGFLIGGGYVDNHTVYGLELFFRATEIKNFETYTTAQLMKSFDRLESKVSFEGEFLYRYNKRLQLGFNMKAEQKKWKEGTWFGPDGLKYDDHFSIAGRLVWTPKNSIHFAVISSVGWSYRNQSSKTLLQGLVWDTSPKDGIKNHVNLSLGLEYKSKY